MAYSKWRMGTLAMLTMISCRSAKYIPETGSSQVEALTQINSTEAPDLTSYKITDPKVAKRMGEAMKTELGHPGVDWLTYDSELNANGPKLSRDLFLEEWVGINLYTGVWYEDLNKDLRKAAQINSEALKSEDAKKTFISLPNSIQLIASGLNKLPKHRCSSTRGSGLPKDVVAAIESSRYYTERAFLSTAEDARPFNADYKFVVSSESCPANIGPISNYQDEKEVLFPPGSEFEVIRAQRNAKGTKRYCVRHVFPTPTGAKPNPILSQEKSAGGRMMVAPSDGAADEELFVNFLAPKPRPLHDITWIDFVCGRYEAQSNLENPACQSLPKVVQFNLNHAAQLDDSPHTVDWSVQNSGSAAPQVTIENMDFDVKAVDTLVYKNCAYRERI